MNLYRWGALGLALAAAAIVMFGTHEAPSRVLAKAAAIALPSAHAAPSANTAAAPTDSPAKP